jgi:hypothetical protein
MHVNIHMCHNVYLFHEMFREDRFMISLIWNSSYKFPISVSYWNCEGSQDSVVGIVTGYGLDNQGVGIRYLVGVRIFTSPCRPDWLRSPPNLLSNKYQKLFPRE